MGLCKVFVIVIMILVVMNDVIMIDKVMIKIIIKLVWELKESLTVM